MWITHDDAARIAREPIPPGYKPQSLDTSPQIDRILMEGYRRMTLTEKARRLGDLCEAVDEFGRIGIRQRYPNASAREVELRLAALRLDRETMIKAFAWDPEKMGY
ncbi:MAG: hypothetical protein HYR85_10090 [Planctomycetes bacterium]|nr:hypothetical protein [Planctomycetota bacterium]MBI3846621.1 hypothetical protein [Planctomycetota bacterium]